MICSCTCAILLLEPCPIVDAINRRHAAPHCHPSVSLISLGLQECLALSHAIICLHLHCRLLLQLLHGVVNCVCLDRLDATGSGVHLWLIARAKDKVGCILQGHCCIAVLETYLMAIASKACRTNKWHCVTMVGVQVDAKRTGV